MIDLERDGPIARLWLNRPESRNALGQDLGAALLECLEPLARDPALRVLVLGGRGPDFCAGGDLNEMRAAGLLPFEQNVRAARGLERLFRALRLFPRPVIARVHGAALGGGSGLAAAADIAIASEDARLGFTEVRLGLVPAVISPYVVARIGGRRARELFLTGERFDGRRAAEIGLVDEAVAPGDLDDAVGRKIAALLQGSPQAQERVKGLLEMVGARSFLDASEETPRFIAEARASEDAREGVAAFFEKRKPRWSR